MKKQSDSHKVEIVFFPVSDSERVKLSMAIASRLIAQSEKPFSAENPVILRGRDKVQLSYLWTALMVFGQDNSTMRFGKEAIKSSSIVFCPDDQLGGWFRFSIFSSNSLYETIFKHYITPDMLVVTRLPQAYVGVSVQKYPTIEAQAAFMLNKKEQVVHGEQEALEAQTRMVELDDKGQGQSDIPGDIQFVKATTLPPNCVRKTITESELCQLAKVGCLSEIKKYAFSSYKINRLVHHAVWGDFANSLGAYNALMVAVAYRHTDVIKYFIEEKQANCSIKGGRHRDITVLDCAKREWWFVTKSDASMIAYLENALSKRRSLVQCKMSLK